MSKITRDRALSYGAAFVGTNMLFPGNFWQNAMSSAGWEASRIAAQKKGLKGWRPWAAAALGSTVVNALWFGAKALSEPSDVAVRSAGFSGRDDPYNFIQGLQDSGLKQTTRHQLTDFGSGYQGPNPWLNPEYNKAEDVYRYKMMRASKLGSSEQELYEYFTKDEEPSEYLAATASAGSALHLVEEAKAVGEGRVLAAEELAFDPQFQVSGHIDLTYQSGAPADVKTVSSKRYQQVLEQGAFEKHVHQLNWYMNQKNAQTGYLEYVNRDDTSQRTVVQVDYNDAMYRADMEKLSRVRRRVQHEIEAGLLNEALLPKTASLETLREAAAAEAGQALEHSKKIDELQEVFNQEMEYLRSVQGRRNLKAANGFVHQRGQKFSGKGRNYNTIESLRHEGLAQHIRRQNTAFGSGFDAIKSLLQYESINEGKKRFLSDKQKRYQVDRTGKFSGRDDEYNTIEGLMHGGIAGDMRVLLTEFGSGWDPLRRKAAQIFKHAKDPMEELRRMPEFIESLAGATEKSVLGEGWFGKATLMEGVFQGEKFQFVRKTGEIGQQEVAAMRAAEQTVAPSVYSSAEGMIDMELFKGSPLQSLTPERARELEPQVAEAFGKLHAAGYEHADPHLGNVFLAQTDQGEKIGLIDLGNAKAFSDYADAELAHRAAQEDINISSKFIRSLGEESQFAAVDPFAAAENIDAKNVWAQLDNTTLNKQEVSNNFIDPFAGTVQRDVRNDAATTFESKVKSDQMLASKLKPEVSHTDMIPKPLGSRSSMAHEVPTGIKGITKSSPMAISPTPYGLGETERVAREAAADGQFNVNLKVHSPGPTPVPQAVHKPAMPQPVTGKQIPNSIQQPKAVPEPDFGRGAGNHRAKRMQRFRNTARKAVGLGHRAAHNAGRRHSKYGSVV